MTEEQAELAERLRAFIEVIVEETRTNPKLAQRLERALNESMGEVADGKKKARRNRRDPPVVDPFALYEQGEDGLRAALDELKLDQLKDIVSGYGMPRVSLALKWKTPERLVELIVDTVKSRSHKGDVFRH